MGNLKIAFITVLLLSLSTSCVVEENTVNNEHKEIHIREVKLSDLDINTLRKLEPKINKFIAPKESDAGRVVYDSIYGFYIEAEKMLLIEKDGKKTYIFSGYRYSDDRLRNVAIAEEIDGTFKTYLVDYSFTEEQYRAMTEEERGFIEPPALSEVLTEEGRVKLVHVCDINREEVIEYNLSYIDGVRIYYHYTFTNCRWEFTGSPDGMGGYNNIALTGNTVYGGAPGAPIQIVPYFMPNDIRRQKNFAMANDCASTLPIDAQNELYNFLENGNSDEVLILGSSSTYPQDRIDFAEEILVKMCAEPETYNSIVPFLIEDKIDDSELDVCSKNVLDQIKGLENMGLTKILAQLDADDSAYTTTIKTAHNYSTVNGITTEVPDPANAVYNTPYNYTIYINPNYPGKTKLFIATLLVHEMIHVYYFSLFDSSSANTATFPLLNANAHHQEMAISYVDIIAATLQEFQTGIPVPEAIEPQQIYKDLAWNGLRQTQIFNTMFPPGSSDRARIINRCISEQIGSDYQGQSVVGNPCY